MNLTMIVLGIGFVLALLLVLGGMLMNAIGTTASGSQKRKQTIDEDLRPAASGAESALDQSAPTVPASNSPTEDGRPAVRTLDLLAKLPPNSRAVKCQHCGATVDSTAELSSNGEIRCNYCSHWTSIY